MNKGVILDEMFGTTNFISYSNREADVVFRYQITDQNMILRLILVTNY